MGDIGAVEEAGISEPVFTGPTEGDVMHTPYGSFRVVKVTNAGTAHQTVDMEPLDTPAAETPAPSPERTEPATPASA